MAEEVVLHAGGPAGHQGKALAGLFVLVVFLTLVAGLFVYYVVPSLPTATV